MPGGWPACVADPRVGQGCGEERRLATGEIARALAEVAPRRRLGTEDAVAPFGNVEIHLHDAALAPYKIEIEGDRQLERLAHVRASRPQEDVLGGLHRNGGRATTRPVVAGIVDHLAKRSP